MKNNISHFDKMAYKKIRTNISFFIKNAARKYDKKDNLVLNIAPQIHSDTEIFFKKSKIEIMDLNKEKKVDYHADLTKNNSDQIENNRFDVVVCTEVLEHVVDPFRAIKEISRIIKEEGVLLISVPFNFRIHGPLPDCWRFTEYGLKYLLTNFKIIELKALETEDRFLMPLHYTVIAKRYDKKI